MIKSILIHNCEPFYPAITRPRFRDIDNLSIKIGTITRKFLINKISNLMRNPANA